VPLKRIRYHNTRTGPEEVKEDPMTTTKVQEQQWQARAKAQKKNGMSNFFLNILLFFEWQFETTKKNHQE
jgi:hypothetical protein